MNSETSERLSEWETERFSGGYDGLRGLADRGFSGAVSAEGSRLFLLNGRVVGVVDGDVADFEDADGTAHEAPHPSLPLLFAMRERGGETRAKYYTEDTALSAADRTLSEGSFTGYVELSENVLSGDYYVVYYGGESMSAAYVGNSDELVTGEEAFERADDEVGIYEVRDVDVNVRDVPEPEPTDRTGERAEPATDADGAAGTEASPDAVTATDGVAGAEAAGEADVADAAESDATGDTGASEAPSDGPERETNAGNAGGDPETTSRDEGSASGGVTVGAATDDVERDGRSTGDAGSDAGEPGTAVDSAGRAEGVDPADGDDPETFEREAAWRETTTIPALDPDDSTATVSAANGDASNGDGGRRNAGTDATGSADRLRERVEALESKLSAVVDERDRLRNRLDELTTERDEAHDRVRELRDRVGELETELDAAQEAAGAGPDREELSPAAALSGTNVFVRYDSKGRETLSDARDGETDRAAVSDNLRLETHAGFERAGVVVDGDPYDEWLTDTVEYGFARWVVEDLLYEIRETGATDGLRDLYDAIPEVDRIEFDGTVSVDAEAGVGREFDVVCRDRMGDPLVVADLNDSLDAASEGQMSTLIEAAQPVGDRTDSLAAAFFVTASYFAPAALETAAAATGGGLLSRDRRESYVQLSRKRGFHLCLVETRNGEYHVNVPQL